MQKIVFEFKDKVVQYLFDASFHSIDALLDTSAAVFITDENVFANHAGLFSDRKTIVIKSGESFKTQTTVDEIILRLIEFEADRSFSLVGVGGGVITDLTGFVASVYLRGISFVFVPTSLLAMVDASIGGKNGIDVGMYKNMVGNIRQPAFILFDTSLLQTLPGDEWINGFAEIIKHAAIKDAALFEALEQNDLSYYRKNPAALSDLIRRNVVLKSEVVQRDEFEQGDRKLLNFGHTLAHAIENIYSLPHGQAVAIGMAFDARLSQRTNGFMQSERLIGLLQKYQLPVKINLEKEKVMEVLRKDKKKSKESIHYILLRQIGEAMIRKIALADIFENLVTDEMPAGEISGN